MTGSRAAAIQKQSRMREAVKEAEARRAGDAFQPDRLPDDPGIQVARDGEHHMTLTVGDKGLRVSLFNAWRLFGSLAFMLGIKLPGRILKGIKL